MQQYNYPTVMYYGEGALDAFVQCFAQKHQKPLIVTDQTLLDVGVVQPLLSALDSNQINYSVFADSKPNPVEDDVINGAELYKQENCDSVIAIGGGGPMDVAKAVKVMVCHEGPLALYDEAEGGDSKIINPMPRLYAVPTTAGTGSEVGRSGVIILKHNNKKSIIFHPDLMPDMAILEPSLTLKLPAGLTAATGIDALTHCLEAFLAPGFHPMADGIAVEGIKLIIQALPKVCADGQDTDARAKMLLAASMGATAFQKGLGMVHSLAHPLSAEFDMHHGLANALLLPKSIEFIEQSELGDEERNRFNVAHRLFRGSGFMVNTFSETLVNFITGVGIELGLGKEGIDSESLEKLSQLAFEDGCHQTNIIPVTQADLKYVYQQAL